MKFSYLKFPAKGFKDKWIVRPFIPIKIFGPKDNWEGYALVDSGADRSLFNAEIAEMIGLDLTKGQTEHFGGISGDPVTAYLIPVKLQVIGSSETIEVVAGFTDSPKVSAILGEDGFFDAYHIKFEKNKEIIEIKLTK